MSDKTPNPGSEEAVKIGCSCPRMDNAYGRGYLGGVKNEDGEVVYVINLDCQVHSADYDPSPYCQYCGAMTEAGCKCGPIVDNH
jgi:hypothetical protein